MSDHPYKITAQYALKKLIVGNRRFVSYQSQHPRQDKERRSEMIGGQNPFAVILTCSDSSVAPEIIFDQGLGDLFVIRTAGNVIDDIALGSIEYAVEHLDVPLIIVLGHQYCGAVIAALQEDNPTSSHISSIFEKITPAIEKSRKMDGDLLENAINENINLNVNCLRNSEPVLSDLFAQGKVKIGGARYDVDTGMVVWL